MLIDNKAAKDQRARKRGFTLVELLVAMFISTILGIAVIQTFISSRDSLSHATGRLEMIQAARIPIERVSSYLTSTVSNNRIDALIYPPRANAAHPNNIFGTPTLANDPSTWEPMIVFRTTEDFFANGDVSIGYTFDPDAIMDITDIKNNIDVWDRDDQRLTEYVIWFEDDTNINWLPNETNVLAMARFSDVIISENKTTGWVQGTWFTKADPTVDFHPATEIRILARDINQVSFRRRLENGLQMAVETEKTIKSAGDPIAKSLRLDTVIQLPTLSMN